MKMSRDQLKLLVKECLIELLNEGLGAVTMSSQPKARQPIIGISEQRRRQKKDYDPRLDTPVNHGRSPTTALKDAIRREAGGNPIMESIFEDTASTTLPAMLAAGDSGGGTAAPRSLAQQELFNGSPEQVFGEETASRWADLAFLDTPGKLKKSA